MDEQKFLSKDKVKQILDNAPTGVDKSSLLRNLVEKRGYTLEGFTPPKPVEQKQSLGSAISNDLKDRQQNINEIGNLRKQGETGFGEVVGMVSEKAGDKVQNFLSKHPTLAKVAQFATPDIATAGQLAGGAQDVIGELISAVTPDKIKEWGTEKTHKLINTALGQAGIKTAEQYADFSEKNPLLAKNIEGILNIGLTAADAVGVGEAGTALSQAGKRAGTAIGEGIEQTTKGLANDAKTFVADATKKASDFGAPQKTVAEAVGQVAQGTTKQIKPVTKALTSIDTKGVKTFKDLSDKIKTSIPEFAKTVDNELSKDATKYALNDLAKVAKTTGGQEVKTDFITRATEHLKEAYTAIGDDVAAKEMEELAIRASKEGLTRKEVNDIARKYGEEFGSKAFGKTGEALTSVNAQAYENTRKGLKEVARKGLGGKEALAADETLSSLYETRKLIDKNVEAVNKLRQKINERGLLEKAGHYISKYADMVTGGSIRGLVGGLLPRGAGYKVLNALDLEELLSKNLETINKAIQSGSDKEIIDAVKSLTKSKKTGFKTATVPETVHPDLKNLYETAPQAKEHIDTLASSIADKHGGQVAKAELKSPERANLKLLGEKKGDAKSITDIARNTVVVPKNKVDLAVKDLLSQEGVHNLKETAHTQDVLGYNGYKMNVKTPNGHVAEVQVNTPDMIYAKESAVNAKKILGDDMFNSLKNKYDKLGVKGGLGHVYYEQFRNLPLTEQLRGRAHGISKQSVDYYKKFM